MQQQTQAPPKTLKVRALRAFQTHERQILKKGDTAVLPRLLALEMKAANKAEVIEDEAPAVARPEEKSPERIRKEK